MLGEGELNNLLTVALQREYVRDLGELELTLARSWSAIPVPDTELTVKIVELPTLGVTANFIVRFELWAGETPLGSWQVPLKARVWREVWVARTSLHRGELLAGADRVRERRDVLALRDAYVAGDVNEATLELAEDVPAGMPLLARSVRARTLVRRGQFAEAIVREGAMAVSLKVEVLENGALGQQVRVRNVQSKREFRGKVEDEKTISVSL
jgi:flagella basal body P-ring formation protein FlgA